MKFYCCLAVAGITLIGHGLPVATAADAQRQHDAHVHGAGTLNLVQEGRQLHLDLDIPGMDIVGFEHKARTAAQKQAVEEAVVALKRGGDLFQMNAEAKCAFNAVEVEVSLLADAHEDDHDDKDGHKPKAVTAHADHDDHHDRERNEAAHHDHKDEHQGEKHERHGEDREESHSEFHAKYVFTCAAPGELKQISVHLFETFTGSESLQVQMVTERQQGARRLTRKAPVIQLNQ